MNRSKIFQRSTILAAAFLVGAGALAFLAFQNSRTLPQRRPYSVGEKAKESIVAPRKFSVIDPIATEVRRQTEAEKVPVVFHFENVAERAVAKFSTEYVFTREKFLDAVEQSFKTRKLTTNQIGPRFRKVFNNFHAKNKSYPVGPRQAEYWTVNSLDEIHLKQMCAVLRKANGRLIRPETFPATNLTFQIRLLPGKETPSSLKLVRQQSRLLRKTNIVGLAKARLELMHAFEKENRAVQKFMTNFLDANCTFDAELTAQFRAEKTNGILITTVYEPGQVIVRAGENIDAKAKAALDQLGIQVATADGNRWKQIWLWAGAISGVFLALVLALFGFARRPRTGPVSAGNVLVLPNVAEDELRARLIPHLARGLMNRFVRALIRQRSELIRSQDAGSEQLSRLEERLDQISTRIENRQLFYETRIAQLEKELAEAEEENRDLIRARIHEARQNLEWAKAQAQARGGE